MNDEEILAAAPKCVIFDTDPRSGSRPTIECLTLRDSTERPITVESGTNRLLGANADAILPAVDHLLEAPVPPVPTVPLWDGSAADRIVDVLERTSFIARPHTHAVTVQAGVAT